jgi:hypothetical protein
MADINELMRRMAAQMMSGSNAGPEARRAGADVPGAYKSNTNRSLPPELLQALLAGSRGPQVNPSAGVGSPSSPLDMTPQRAANRPADWHWNEAGQVGKFDSAQVEAMAGRIMDDDSTYESKKFGKIVRKQAPVSNHPVGSGMTPNLQDRVSGHNPGDNRNVVGHFGHEVVEYEDGTVRERCIRPDLGCDTGMRIGEWYHANF